MKKKVPLIEQMHRKGKKDKTGSFQYVNEKSMMQPQVVADMCTHV